MFLSINIERRLKNEQGPKNPLKIQDMTFRDGHQSNLATRMRTEDMIPVAEQMDEIPFLNQ